MERQHTASARLRCRFVLAAIERPDFVITKVAIQVATINKQNVSDNYTPLRERLKDTCSGTLFLPNKLIYGYN